MKLIDKLYNLKNDMPDLQIKEIKHKIYVFNIQTVSSSMLSNDYVLNYLANRSIFKSFINIYSDYIFNIDENNKDELKKIEDLDYVLSKYIDDYSFRKETQNELLKLRIKRGSNIIDVMINAILKIFEKYQEGYTRNIYFSRWV